MSLFCDTSITNPTYLWPLHVLIFKVTSLAKFAFIPPFNPWLEHVLHVITWHLPQMSVYHVYGAPQLLSRLVFLTMKPVFEIWKCPEVRNCQIWTIWGMGKQLKIQILHCVLHNAAALAWRVIMVQQNPRPLQLWALSFNNWQQLGFNYSCLIGSSNSSFWRNKMIYLTFVYLIWFFTSHQQSFS